MRVFFIQENTMGVIEDNDKKVALVIEKQLEVLGRHYNVKKLDAGKFARPVTLKTQFIIEHYEIEGVGHLMTMATEGNPMMQMATCTLMPYFKALPMLNFDYMFGGEDKGMYLSEVYELVSDRENESFKKFASEYKEILARLASLEDIPSAPSFLDALRPVYICKSRAAGTDDAAFDVLVKMTEKFCEQEKSLPVLSEEERKAQAAIQHKYADDLIDQQGFSTKMWVAEHGEDYVREFYHEVFFGV